MTKYIAQYINSSGKQSAIMFKGNIWILIELKAPELLPELEITESPIEKVLEFCKENEYEIISKFVAYQQIRGITVSRQIEGSFQSFSGIIPIVPVRDDKYLQKVRVSTENNFFKASTSLIKSFHIEQKVAEILKTAVLELYGNLIRNNKGKEDLKKAIKVYEKEFSDISSVELEKVFDGRILKVPSEEIKNRLVRYADATYYSSPNKVVVPSSTFQFYQSTDDFIQRPGQKIFLSQDALFSFMQTTKEEKNLIYNGISRVFSDTEEPFIFRHIRFNSGRPVLVQKVLQDSLERCKWLCAKWAESKINEGFDYSPIEPPNIEHGMDIYNIQGRIHDSVKGRKLTTIKILMFDKEKFAAMFYL